MSKGRIGETYNIGGDNECANIDIVRLICRRIDAAFARDESLAVAFPEAPPAKGAQSESLITFVKDRLGHDWRYAIDATRSRSELGYEPLQSFDSGLDLTLDWMLANVSWWRSVMDGSQVPFLPTSRW